MTAADYNPDVVDDGDMFDDPGSTTLVDWHDLDGKLLLIKPIEKVDQIQTEFGETTAVRADLVILDGVDGPERIDDTLVFPKVLQGQLRRNTGTGRYNLGRLTQGEKKKKNFDPPWQLQAASETDKAVARRYLSGANGQPPF